MIDVFMVVFFLTNLILVCMWIIIRLKFDKIFDFSYYSDTYLSREDK